MIGLSVIGSEPPLKKPKSAEPKKSPNKERKKSESEKVIEVSTLHIIFEHQKFNVLIFLAFRWFR